MKALGMIELYGYLPAVEALDAALKAANVTLVDTVCVKGGLVTVLVEGDVGAVKAAMDASAAAAERVGTVISVHVIPRPADEVRKMLQHDRQHPGPTGGPGPSAVQENRKTEIPEAPEEKTSGTQELTEKEAEVPAVSEEKMEEAPEPEAGKAEAAEALEAVQQPEAEELTEEALKGMSVAALRRLARTLEITGMSRQEIKFAKKQELIHAILKFAGKE